MRISSLLIKLIVFISDICHLSLVKSRGGGVLPYIKKPRRYVPPQRVGSLRRFGLKKGIDFVQFVLESSMVSDGTTGVHGTYFSF